MSSNDKRDERYRDELRTIRYAALLGAVTFGAIAAASWIELLLG